MQRGLLQPALFFFQSALKLKQADTNSNNTEGNVRECQQYAVWQAIKQEAREQSEQEPMLASFYHATIIKHDNLAAALSYILANKLATPSMPAMAVREVIEEAFAADCLITESAACDIRAVVERDPAVEMFSIPLLYLKGFHALQATGSPTGCGSKTVSHWRCICRTRFRWRARWMSTRQRVLGRGSCSTMPPG